jgi:GTPase SAR1 family protein
MNITRGVIPTAKKVVIYGPEGIGKTTFAAQFPGAVFLDTEGSTVHMDVARLDSPVTWADILATVDWAVENHSAIGTFVIDTMDWAEAMAFREVCKRRRSPASRTSPTARATCSQKTRSATCSPAWTG